ncbi:MAG: POTRA domain-containing protein [Bacteroidota bacterium]
MLVLLLFLCLSTSDLQAHTDERDTTAVTTLEVGRVLIIGNKVTRDRIILRELTLLTGDTISSNRLDEVIKKDQNKIYNLRLFNTVTIRPIAIEKTKIDLLVEVSERWYTFPSPIFEISDRNFNEWWQNYNHDFRRVNYGLRLYQYNFRGRNETLRFTAQFGFTRRFQLSYRIPNLTRSQKHGLIFDFDYGEPKNLAYFTNDHKLEFQQGRTTLKTTLGAAISYSYRRSFYETHSIVLEYRDSHVADTIVKLNPNYYANGSPTQRYGAISYSFNSEHRDVVAYPLRGYQFTGYISKSGLGLGDNVNMVEANLTYAQHVDLKKGFFLANFSSFYYSNPTTQPYSLYGALGYRKQFIRGYEIYVIEGPQFALNKTTFKKRIFSRTWEMDDMPVEQFRHFPLTIYLKSYVDLGYVTNYPRYDELNINTTLSNKFLAGAGAGVDIVSLYDTVFRFEYTFTQQIPRGGFFFNIKKEF